MFRVVSSVGGWHDVFAASGGTQRLLTAPFSAIPSLNGIEYFLISERQVGEGRREAVWLLCDVKSAVDPSFARDVAMQVVSRLRNVANKYLAYPDELILARSAAKVIQRCNVTLHRTYSVSPKEKVVGYSKRNEPQRSNEPRIFSYISTLFIGLIAGIAFTMLVHTRTAQSSQPFPTSEWDSMRGDLSIIRSSLSSHDCAPALAEISAEIGRLRDAITLLQQNIKMTTESESMKLPGDDALPVEGPLPPNNTR